MRGDGKGVRSEGSRQCSGTNDLSKSSLERCEAEFEISASSRCCFTKCRYM